MLWSYGITTVPERRATTLPQTLQSLKVAGFDRPRLFIDGTDDEEGYRTEFNLQVTARKPRLGAWGNWFLALQELYLREPVCERFAIFQDDVVAVKGLKDYLDSCRYPNGKDGRQPGYWNLYTTLNSEMDIVDRGVRCGWIEGALMINATNPQMMWQCGRGALGLVFNREAAGIILSAASSVGKSISTDRPTRNIDGAVVTAMNLRRSTEHPHGWREYVHGPSLLSHTGVCSTVIEGKEWKKNADTFPGEGADIREVMARVV